MSRRESRDSESRRHRSRFDREPSPKSKRSRREGKPESERAASDADEKKQRRRLQDAVPLEDSSSASKLGFENGKELERKEKDNDGSKHSSDPTQVPRSRSYFQHDERGNAAQADRSVGRRAATERGWWRDAKDQQNERETKAYDTRQRDEKPQAKGNGNGDWRHDRFFEMEADAPPTRKRPAFSEKKIQAETQGTDNTTKEPIKASHSGHQVLGSERRVDRERNPQHLDRQDRLTARDQGPNRREAPRGGFSSYERRGAGGGNFRGRDRFGGRPGYHSGGTRGEKWKHDLFEDANTSPPRKNEEDQIAAVESLLAS